MKCARCPALVSPESPHLVAGGIPYYFCPTCSHAAIAHATSTPTMRDDQIQTPFPVLSRGKVFRVYACGEAFHPSWWAFSDELETRELWWHIKPGDVVADVGADFGSYTLSALAQGAATVYSWSPPFKLPTDPIEARTLMRSAELNGWAGRLQLFASGLWSKGGALAAFDGPRPSRYFPTLGEANAAIVGQHGNCAAFPVERLDAYNIPRLDWLKADVEGAELEVLNGAEQTIDRCHPAIMLEHHYHLDPDCETKCAAWLRARGYEQDGATRPHGIVAHSLYRHGGT